MKKFSSALAGTLACSLIIGSTSFAATANIGQNKDADSLMETGYATQKKDVKLKANNGTEKITTMYLPTDTAAGMTYQEIVKDKNGDQVLDNRALGRIRAYATSGEYDKAMKKSAVAVEQILSTSSTYAAEEKASWTTNEYEEMVGKLSTIAIGQDGEAMLSNGLVVGAAIDGKLNPSIYYSLKDAATDLANKALAENSISTKDMKVVVNVISAMTPSLPGVSSELIANGISFELCFGQAFSAGVAYDVDYKNMTNGNYVVKKDGDGNRLLANRTDDTNHNYFGMVLAYEDGAWKTAKVTAIGNPDCNGYDDGTVTGVFNKVCPVALVQIDVRGMSSGEKDEAKSNAEKAANEQTKADLTKTQDELKKAQTELKKLQANEAANKAELDAAQAKVDSLQAELDAAKSSSSNDDLKWETGADGKSYWYEDGVKQGTTSDPKAVSYDGVVRGREIYDPESNGWYWLDAKYDGAKATSKEVFMPYIYQGDNSDGKWVRYDANGKMIKGLYTVSGADANIYPDQAGNTYYYDLETGQMAKDCELIVGGVTYHFDAVTGVGVRK